MAGWRLITNILKRNRLTIFLLWVLSTAQAQQGRYFSVSLTDQATAYPFGILAGYFSNPVHPGMELGYGQIVRDKPRHAWFREVHAGYFYHRFVQHGIPVYGQYGYRYKAFPHFSLEAALGAGYFHSIPATAVFKLNGDGDYRNAKGIGRPQVMLPLHIGAGYVIGDRGKQPVRLFLHYQQRLQAPFVRSYVPILPYVQVAAGAALLLDH